MSLIMILVLASLVIGIAALVWMFSTKEARQAAKKNQAEAQVAYDKSEFGRRVAADRRYTELESRIYAGTPVALVDDVYGTQEVGIYTGTESDRYAHTNVYGLYTIQRADGRKFRNQGRLMRVASV